MIVQSSFRHRGYLHVVVDKLDPGVASNRHPTLMSLAGTWRIAGYDAARRSIALEGDGEGIEPGEELIWIG